MDVTFGFLRASSRTYRAEVPEIFSIKGASSVVTRGGISRSLAFLARDSADEGFLTGKNRVREVRDRGGTAVAVYEQPDPLLHILKWDLQAGSCWTWSNPSADGPDGARELADSLIVRDHPRGWPATEVLAGVGRGDVRRMDERDTVVFYSRDEFSVNGSVAFIDAASFAADRELFDGPRAIVARKTNFGIEVACDGPTDELKDLRARATAIAATLAPG